MAEKISNWSVGEKIFAIILLSSLVVILGIILGSNLTGNAVKENLNNNCRQEQIPYEDQETYTDQEPYTDYESSEQEVSKIAIDGEGTLIMESGIVGSNSQGEKSQWKVLCFDVPYAWSVRGKVVFNEPLWFMINDRENVMCETWIHHKEEKYEGCGYTLGYAYGSQETYQSFDFGWTGNEELCLSMSGHKENDKPITYNVFIETYGTEINNNLITKYRNVTNSRTVTKYKTETVCD